MHVKKTVSSLASVKLASVLGVLLMLFALAGAVLPQTGAMEERAVAEWQARHVLATAVFSQVGLFHVFTSWPFLITILILAVNTLACTADRFSRIKKNASSPRIEFWGSIIFHLGLIALLLGGAWSAAMRFDGYVVLTEGQVFKDLPEAYLRSASGVFRKNEYSAAECRLKSVSLTYKDGKHLVDLVSTFEVDNQPGGSEESSIRVNRPWRYKDRAFTQDKTGFSPYLSIYDAGTGLKMFGTYVALRTLEKPDEREYKDFLPLQHAGEKLMITLYPSAEIVNGEIHNYSDELKSPMLRLERMDAAGQVVAEAELPNGGQAVLGNLVIRFEGVRYWSSFRVVHDPGYPLVVLSLWIALIALIARYAPAMIQWLRT